MLLDAIKPLSVTLLARAFCRDEWHNIYLLKPGAPLARIDICILFVYHKLSFIDNRF